MIVLDSEFSFFFGETLDYFTIGPQTVIKRNHVRGVKAKSLSELLATHSKNILNVTGHLHKVNVSMLASCMFQTC